MPTGVASVRLPPLADVTPATGWAVAGPRGAGRGVSDHTLAGRTGAATLAGLTSAPAPTSKRRRAPRLLYDMGWQVEEVVQPVCARPARALPRRRPKRALAAAVAGLQLNSRLNLPTHLTVWGGDAALGDGPGGPPRGCASGAAVAALARVAAGEGAPVSVAEVDVLSASSSVPPSHDAFGAAAGGGAVCVPRAAPTPVSPPLAPAPTAHPHTALIVGGLGGLGSLAASWLSAACPGVLAVVTGRAARARPLRGLPSLIAISADASTRADAADLAAMPPPNRTSLALLAAGVLADGGVAGATPSALRAAAAPKPAALAALTPVWMAAAPRAGVHVYGSISAVVGSAGQAAYAAANNAAAAVVATLAARGTPATALQWGPWSGTGMAASSASALARAARAGLGVVAPPHGLAALAAALAGRLARSVAPLASPLAWDALARAAGVAGMPAALASADDREPVAAVVVAERQAAEAVPSPHPTRRVTRVAVADIIATTLTSILGTTLPPSARLMDAGLDSLGAGELRAALSSALRVPLPATLAFDWPTPEALVDGLVKLVGAAEEAESVEIVAMPAVPRAVLPASTPSVTVLAVCARVPGSPSSSTLPDFAASAHDATSPTPADRWDADALFGARAMRPAVYARLAAHDALAAAFDAPAFSLPPSEAAALDPGVRLLLEGAATAFGRVGGSARILARPHAVGVFAGSMHAAAYADLLTRCGAPLTPAAATGNSLAFLAGRLAHAFGLGGPAAAIDTACSSSLVALHLASRALTSREAAASLVAGVNVMVSASAAAATCALGALAPAGRCRALDASADGYGRADGAVVVVLGGEGDAADSDAPPLALIAGSGVGLAGRAAGLTAPSGPAQASVVAAALRAAGAAPADVAAVSLHGTGTPLGDPIEVGALVGGRDASSSSTPPLTLLASKASLGHAEGAAGLVSALFAAADAGGGPRPGVLHLRSLNPHVGAALAGGATAPRAVGPSHTASALRGASSFGMSGVDAHTMVVGGGGGGARPSMAAPEWRRAAAWPAPLAASVTAAVLAATPHTVTLAGSVRGDDLAAFTAAPVAAALEVAAAAVACASSRCARRAVDARRVRRRRPPGGTPGHSDCDHWWRRRDRAVRRGAGADSVSGCSGDGCRSHPSPLPPPRTGVSVLTYPTICFLCSLHSEHPPRPAPGRRRPVPAGRRGHRARVLSRRRHWPPGHRGRGGAAAGAPGGRRARRHRAAGWEGQGAWCGRDVCHCGRHARAARHAHHAAGPRHARAGVARHPAHGPLHRRAPACVGHHRLW